jgi:hypothetical protein
VRITHRYIYDVPILDVEGRFVVYGRSRIGLRCGHPFATLVSEGASMCSSISHASRISMRTVSGSLHGASRHCAGRAADGTDCAESVGAPTAALTRLDTILAIYDSECDAITSSFGGLPTRRCVVLDDSASRGSSPRLRSITPG